MAIQLAIPASAGQPGRNWQGKPQGDSLGEAMTDQSLRMSPRSVYSPRGDTEIVRRNNLLLDSPRGRSTSALSSNRSSPRSSPRRSPRFEQAAARNDQNKSPQRRQYGSRLGNKKKKDGSKTEKSLEKTSEGIGLNDIDSILGNNKLLQRKSASTDDGDEEEGDAEERRRMKRSASWRKRSDAAAARRSQLTSMVSIDSLYFEPVPEDLEMLPKDERKAKMRIRREKTRKHASQKREKSEGAWMDEVTFWRNQIAELAPDEHKKAPEKVIPDGCPLSEEHLHWQAKVDSISLPTPGGSSIINHFPRKGSSPDEELHYWQQKMSQYCVPTAKLVELQEGDRLDYVKGRHFWSLRRALDHKTLDQLVEISREASPESRPASTQRPKKRSGATYRRRRRCSMERAKMIKQMFECLDKDDNGFLDEAEIYPLMVAMGEEVEVDFDDIWMVICDEMDAHPDIGLGEATFVAFVEPPHDDDFHGNHEEAPFCIQDGRLPELLAKLEEWRKEDRFPRLPQKSAITGYKSRPGCLRSGKLKTKIRMLGHMRSSNNLEPRGPQQRKSYLAAVERSQGQNLAGSNAKNTAPSAKSSAKPWEGNPTRAGHPTLETAKAAASTKPEPASTNSEPSSPPDRRRLDSTVSNFDEPYNNLLRLSKGVENAPKSKSLPKKPYQLEVTIMSATGLASSDRYSASDPFCVCLIPGRPEVKKVQTKTIDNNNNPVWDHCDKIRGWIPGDRLLFKVYDKDLLANDLLGSVLLGSEHIERQGGYEGSLQLKDTKGKDASGKLSVKTRVLEAVAADVPAK